MDETRLRTIEQLQEFLKATPEVVFTAPPVGSAADNQRYGHISRVLARFDYPQRNKHERGLGRGKDDPEIRIYPYATPMTAASGRRCRRGTGRSRLQRPVPKTASSEVRCRAGPVMGEKKGV